MSTPGAASATCGPCSDSSVTFPLWSVAATPTTPLIAAGYSTRLPALPELPAAANSRTPRDAAWSTAALSLSRSVGFSETAGMPSDMLMIFAS